MRFLVTGDSGFAGSHLCRLLKAGGDGVVSLDKAGVDVPRVDVRDRDLVRRAVVGEGVDGVFHLAAPAFVPAVNSDVGEARSVIVEGTRNVLDAALEAGVRTLVVSSGHVYGAPGVGDLPATEDLPRMPADAYGDAKSEAEAECESRAGGQDVVRARPFNHTGPGQSSDFVCSDFASQVVDCERGEEPGLIRVGDLRSERDFSDVRDVVRAYKLLFDHGVAGQAYNICSGRPAAVSRVLDILISLSTADIKVEVETERLRPGEVGRLWGSYAKLRALTGWEPQIALEATLADLLEDRRSDGAV